jgi:hypothetical protein
MFGNSTAPELKVGFLTLAGDADGVRLRNGSSEILEKFSFNADAKALGEVTWQ